MGDAGERRLEAELGIPALPPLSRNSGTGGSILACNLSLPVGVLSSWPL